MKVEKRAYRMAARAEAAEATARRLIEAMQELFVELPFVEITLEEVARRAGVTLQTLLRRFGSKSGLLAAAAADALERITAQRGEATPGDVVGAVSNLVEHYEQWGRTALRLLAEEDRVAELAELTRLGRASHAAWVERVFAGELERRRGRARAVRRAQLVALTDVYVWKILRHDQRLSRAEAERATREMIEALSAGDKPHG